MLNQNYARNLTLVLSIASTLFISACGTNPVTHKREIQFVSESQEISIGKQNYAPTRQAQGGDYVIDPELTAYVQSVGDKLAAVADRKLPYEYAVINDSTPNAWAMPGGKIAFNRGLLYELNSEAELAAVMGHEMVHAAARHGAKSMERGVLLQGAMIAVGIGAQNSDYANLIVGGAQVGAQLTSKKYGRDAESESDLYGMQYMKKAGYDPTAAVTLQETFVRLSADRKSNFIEGLFASHPPSPERVAANKVTLTQVGAGGELGKEIYAQKVSKLKSTQAAYKSYDEGVKALAAKDTVKATTLAKQAIAGEPREARFQELLGDIALTQKKPQEALAFYDKAIKMQPDYFKPHIQSGIALFNMGKKTEAEPYLKRANELLPTAPSHALLGQIAEERGQTDIALQHYQVAAGSNSEIGKEATARGVRLDLPRNPAKYIQAGAQSDNAGNLYAVVQNSTAVPVGRVQVRVIKYDAKTGRAVSQSAPMTITGGVAPGKRNQIAVGTKVSTAQEAQLYKVVVEAAELAQ
ncbi:MAG: M48 family metalloprotease [Methylotenera sp.]|uniref:M48 family metalloprotease n=1 Tax=Methylotenera sp. TaxID=2051956 RepID=UPI0027235ACA|nr:M48 family metalloprotease [Methylotenera sp.]MDO9204998.1 M48 family metalloprotease [Methylotenera sp.]MDO9392400.1 M48 family metalloprotease [Methylotenera sp.]MDP3307162.1 M48 family metalloprotease [Methylotenera sp.]MDP3819054.1 M48 family metalloprotease [Methylotenera sp.]